MKIENLVVIHNKRPADFVFHDINEERFELKPDYFLVCKKDYGKKLISDYRDLVDLEAQIGKMDLTKYQKQINDLNDQFNRFGIILNEFWKNILQPSQSTPRQ